MATNAFKDLTSASRSMKEADINKSQYETQDYGNFKHIETRTIKAEGYPLSRTKIGTLKATSSAASEAAYGTLSIPAGVFQIGDWLEFKLVGVTDDVAATVRVRYTINSVNVDYATAMSFTTRIGGIGSLAEDPLTNDVVITEFHGCHNTAAQLHRINSVDTNAVHPLTGAITITFLIASPNTSATINVDFYRVMGGA